MPTARTAEFAKILLLSKGELSRSDLAAIPWIEDEKEIDLIMDILQRNLHASIYQRRVKSSSIPEWEEVIVLNGRN